MTNVGMPRVVIDGMGFAGLQAAKALATLPVHVTLIDRNNRHSSLQPLSRPSAFCR